MITKDKVFLKIVLVVVIISFMVFSSISPLTFGHNTITRNVKSTKESFNYDDFNIYLYPEYVAMEKYSEYFLQSDNRYKNEAEVSLKNNYQNTIPKNVILNPVQSFDGPMDSAWPMQSHDTRHTGLSPYSTIDTWDRIWNFETKGWALSSPAIDKNGTIYIGSWYFYAVYPNGTLKWQSSGDLESSCPAIDEDGTIYIGTPGSLRAINPDGSAKWKYPASGIESSPALGDDGTIYFADTDNWNIKALYPNGSLKWSYHTNHVIYSSPAIGDDGTVYCGSHDNYVYALYSNNGTLKWKYDTGSWVHGAPTIGEDGTVYIGSDNGYLYAFYPNNGTVKWKVHIGEVYGSPALDEEGNLYVGSWNEKFYSIYPNGTIKWSFDTGAHVWGSSAALSSDGTLYFGTCDLEFTGGIEIIALYSDGTVKWRKKLDTVFSSPAIGEDGNVYIGCNHGGDGYLVAFGRVELNANSGGPYYGLINDPVHFNGKGIGGYSPFSYHWDFGDGQTSDEQNPTHIYTENGNYSVTFTVIDNTSNISIDTTYAWIQNTNTPPNKPVIDGLVYGIPWKIYDYKFVSADPDGTPIYYYIDWDDPWSGNTGWIGSYSSGKQITESHGWTEKGTYIIRCKAKDPYGEEGPWGELKVIMPRNKAIINSFSYSFLELFPLLKQLFSIYFL